MNIEQAEFLLERLLKSKKPLYLELRNGRTVVTDKPGPNIISSIAGTNWNAIRANLKNVVRQHVRKNRTKLGPAIRLRRASIRVGSDCFPAVF